LVEQAFGSSTSIHDVNELTDGWFNTAYAIVLQPGGGQTVLKVGPPADAEILAYEKGILKAEVEVMQLMATDPDIPVPQIQFADWSRSLLPNDYYFMEFVPGSPWNKVRGQWTEQDNYEIGRQLGHINQRINRFENASFGYYASGPRFDRWPNAFRFMLEQLLEDGAQYQIDLPLSASGFIDRYDRFASHFADVTRPKLVAWDLWDGNVFVDIVDGKPTIRGIVDLERALWGDPLLEHYFGRDDNQAFLEGYAQNLQGTHSARVRLLFYRLYLWLVMVIEDGPRQYTDKRAVRWARGRLQADLATLDEMDN